jgi:hypothetical protein
VSAENTSQIPTAEDLDDDRNIWHSSPAKSRPELEPLLQRFFVLIIRTVFNDDDDIVAFTDFAAFFLLGLSLPLCISHTSRRGGWVEDILCNIILQHTTSVSTPTSR